MALSKQEIDAALFVRNMDTVMLLSDQADDSDILYDQEFTITFAGRSVTVPCCAAIYNAVYNGLRETYEQLAADQLL